MKEKGKRFLGIGSILVVGFVIWTLLIQRVDVQPLGVNGTDIGFATINCWFHQLTGVHMEIYTITDWLGLVPIFICMIFGGIGCVQLMKGRSLFKVDYDIILLGIYNVLVVFGYLIFEMIPINYRPILIEGFMEASYPFSTTLLVLCVMPTLIEQINRRSKNEIVKKVIKALVICFSAFMVFGRLATAEHDAHVLQQQAEAIRDAGKEELEFWEMLLNNEEEEEWVSPLKQLETHSVSLDVEKTKEGFVVKGISMAEGFI